jgi:hypothetical protein
MSLRLFLVILSGLAWMVVYVDSNRENPTADHKQDRRALMGHLHPGDGKHHDRAHQNIECTSQGFADHYLPDAGWRDCCSWRGSQELMIRPWFSWYTMSHRDSRLAASWVKSMTAIPDSASWRTTWHIKWMDACSQPVKGSASNNTLG